MIIIVGNIRACECLFLFTAEMEVILAIIILLCAHCVSLFIEVRFLFPSRFSRWHENTHCKCQVKCALSPLATSQDKIKYHLNFVPFAEESANTTQTNKCLQKYAHYIPWMFNEFSLKCCIEPRTISNAVIFMFVFSFRLEIDEREKSGKKT